MIKRVTMFITVLAICFSTIALANRALIRAQTKQFDMEMCVALHANSCINQTCLTSEERDCQSKCQELATSKCLDLSQDH